MVTKLKIIHPGTLENLKALTNKEGMFLATADINED